MRYALLSFFDAYLKSDSEALEKLREIDSKFTGVTLYRDAP